MITVGTSLRYRGMVQFVTSKEFRPTYMFTIAGILVIGVLAVVFSGRVAGVTAGVLMLGVAGLRATGRGSAAISARSRNFDTVLLTALGVGILILALTADNI